MRFLQDFLPDMYKSAEQPENWCLALDQLKHELQMGNVVLQMFGRSGDRLVQHWQVRDSDSTRDGHLHDQLVNNAENPRLQMRNDPSMLLDSCIIQDEPQATANDDSFRALRERLQQLGLGRPLILGMRYSADTYCSLVMHRYYDDQRGFDPAQIELLQQLTPHLRQAVSLAEKMGQLQQQNDQLLHTLDHLNAGVVMLDDQAEVRWLNHRAKHILQRSNHLYVNGNRLRCHTLADQASLSELLGQAANFSSAPQRRIARLGSTWDNPLQLLSLPMKHPGPGGRPGMVLYITEQQQQLDLSPREVVQLFGLTPAESRLAIALSDGVALNDYAEQAGITVGTARIQLKSIFAKLGIHRQPELVQLLSTSVSAHTLRHIA